MAVVTADAVERRVSMRRGGARAVGGVRVEVLAEAMNRPVQSSTAACICGGCSSRVLGSRLSRWSSGWARTLTISRCSSSWRTVRGIRRWWCGRSRSGWCRRSTLQAWVLDDTGFPKDGKDSPGVKRQYSGTLGKTGNCQIGVSVHAVGGKGTVPLGWALYLPEEWCDDAERRRKAKIPEEVVFKTKPELGVELVERAAGWEITKAPILGDCAYGKNTELRERLDTGGLEYVLSVSPETTVFAPETEFEVPAPRQRGPANRRPRPDREPEQIGELIARLGPSTSRRSRSATDPTASG